MNDAPRHPSDKKLDPRLEAWLGRQPLSAKPDLTQRTLEAAEKSESSPLSEFEDWLSDLPQEAPADLVDRVLQALETAPARQRPWWDVWLRYGAIAATLALFASVFFLASQAPQPTESVASLTPQQGPATDAPAEGTMLSLGVPQSLPEPAEPPSDLAAYEEILLLAELLGEADFLAEATAEDGSLRDAWVN